MKCAKTVLLVLAIAVVALAALIWWESGWECVLTSQWPEMNESGATWWRTVRVPVTPKRSRESN
jgi:hypothetical protein